LNFGAVFELESDGVARVEGRTAAEDAGVALDAARWAEPAFPMQVEFGVENE